MGCMREYAARSCVRSAVSRPFAEPAFKAKVSKTPPHGHTRLGTPGALIRTNIKHNTLCPRNYINQLKSRPRRRRAGLGHSLRPRLVHSTFCRCCQAASGAASPAQPFAAAIARTTTRIEQACQEVLHWARQLPDGPTFAAHINRPTFASDAMRSSVEVFRANLAMAGAPTDEETVWRLLRRFQILVFDFESTGSDYDHRARENLRWMLGADQADRANDLWPVLVDYVCASARAAGATDRATIVTTLEQQHGIQLTPHSYLRPVYERL